MRKIMFVGRSECGKTTLTQAMKGKKIIYHKTQYVNHYDVVIDTPGEYAETKRLGGSLAVYSAESDIVGLLISLFQTLTQIQEMTLVFVPKILLVFLALIFLLPFMIEQLRVFTNGLFDRIIGLGS